MPAPGRLTLFFDRGRRPVDANIEAKVEVPSQAVGLARSVLFSMVLMGASAGAARAQSTGFATNRFEPAELQVPAGKKIRLLVKNLDPSPEEFESPDLKREKVIPGGERITVYIGPLKPGRYEFFGDFNPKTARGHIIAK